MAASPGFALRPFAREDMPLLHGWLVEPHVHPWWPGRGTPEQTVAAYAPAIAGDGPTGMLAIVVDGRAVGLVRTWLLVDDPDHASGVGPEEGSAALDVLVGEVALTGRGLGSAVISAAVEQLFARADVDACIAGPDRRNRAALGAFRNAGFRRMWDYEDPDDGELHVLLRRQR